MSYFSLVNLVLFFAVLPCIFFYHPFIMTVVLCVWVYLFRKYVVWDIFMLRISCKMAFWLFLVRELIVFLTIIFCCFWYIKGSSVAISYPLGIPILETYLLIMSSFFISAFHRNLASVKGRIFVYLSLVCSLLFIFFAVDEFLNSVVNSLCDPYYASCFMLVGLHLRHVILGRFGLYELSGFQLSRFIRWKNKMLIVYWHFVDYIWLLVYLVVYIVHL